MRLAALTILFSGGLFAQVNTGSISGRITDSSDAVVANAKVTLSNTETGVSARTETSSAGTYLFTPLQPGSYRISVEAPGFKTTSRDNLVLNVGDKLGVDLGLEVGQITETVDVKAETPLIQSENATVGQVIDNRKIMELPLPSRDPMRLAQLAPGVGEPARA